MPYSSLQRQPSLDLRKAARIAELATKHEIESFSLEDDMENLYRSNTKNHKLRLSTSSPMLTSIYQSDEEQASPHTEDFDDSVPSEYASCESEEETDDLDFDGDDEEVDFDSDIEIATITSALAVAVPLRCVKPSIVDISVLAPMAERSIPISRPQSASYATFTRVKAPSPSTVRSSIYGSVAERPITVRNFSTPLPRTRSMSPPESFQSGTSPASSQASLEDFVEEPQTIIRNSNESQLRQIVLAGTEWDDAILDSPTPTSWAAYDPFALAMPTLVKGSTYQHGEIPEKHARGWKRLGLKTKLLAAGRTARWGPN